ncbi:MAG TPA: long-chain fatty acid--CoA ligase [Bdellovibrionota bacterium]|nr:long-chain fatty acid--CoA ligase [Bdellovibrionota bacterium]
MPTVLHRLAKWAEVAPNAVAQTYKKDGRRVSITAKEFMDRVYHLALFLESRGLSPKDSGCIFAYNSPEWVHMDLATLLVGARSAGIYPNSVAKDIQYILNHTESRVLGVQNKEYFQRITDESGNVALPKSVELVIVFDNDASVSRQAVGYKTAIAEGAKLAQAKGESGLKQFLDRIKPTEGAFMIYTSGTTGNPKGALLSHDNLVYTSDLASRYWSLPLGRGSMFSFLPLCHIAEKLQNVGVGISQRYAVNFATKFENVAAELPEVQPTLLLCVPRLWEKMMEGVLDKVAKGKGAKKVLATWALGVGARVADAKYSGRAPGLVDKLALPVADKLVLSKIRQALGLGKAELLASGAAALPAHVAKWFRSLGLEILEDFGQTESTGVICMTEPGVDSLGTVGKAVPGVEFKLAADGEILTRGRHVFVGYFKDEASTRATLEGGWLHTGDLGELNEKGQVRIRGRKKEILKTSGGKMIAPLPIEEALKAAPMISQVCVVGDGRKFVSALITLSESTLNDLKGRNGALSGKVVDLPEVVKRVRDHIDELNGKLASYEQIKKFAVLSKEFSIVDGEMTPTLKMKRNVIETRYRDVIDQLYA